MPHKAVFLDRDNTVIDDPGYLADPQGVRLLPGVEEALTRLAGASWRLIVVTNQSGVARGLLTEDMLQQVHAEIQRQLAQRGAKLDAIYYCPFLPEAPVEAYARDSDERKPKPGMLLRAAREMDLDLRASWMVGDSDRDIQAGRRAGCRTILIRHDGDQSEPVGQGDRGEPAGQDDEAWPDFTARNLQEAAEVILRESPAEPSAANPNAAPQSGGREIRPSHEMSDSQVLQELLQMARQLVQGVQRQQADRRHRPGSGAAGVRAGGGQIHRPQLARRQFRRLLAIHGLPGHRRLLPGCGTDVLPDEPAGLDTAAMRSEDVK
jgi:D,D-heptose 1,7-bisphosphate phosphatase